MAPLVDHPILCFPYPSLGKFPKPHTYTQKPTTDIYDIAYKAKRSLGVIGTMGVPKVL